MCGQLLLVFTQSTNETFQASLKPKVLSIFFQYSFASILIIRVAKRPNNQTTQTTMAESGTLVWIEIPSKEPAKLKV
jgi:hypothetical protein